MKLVDVFAIGNKLMEAEKHFRRIQNSKYGGICGN